MTRRKQRRMRVKDNRCRRSWTPAKEREFSALIDRMEQQLDRVDRLLQAREPVTTTFGDSFLP